MAEDGDFISRWSKRKAEARDGLLDDDIATEPAAQAAGTEAAAPQSPAAEQAGAPADDEIPEDLRGIDIDSLGYDADFTVFMKAGVPEALRQKALRRLWRSDPVLACLDGLTDFEEDYTDAKVAVSGLQTAYRVGKGYLFAEEEAIEPDVDAEGAGEIAEPQGGEAPAADGDDEGEGAPDDPPSAIAEAEPKPQPADPDKKA
jgi:hypothetical protein